jgi:hypothetical protein
MFKGFVVLCCLALLLVAAGPVWGDVQPPAAGGKSEPVVSATAPASAPETGRQAPRTEQVVEKRTVTPTASMTTKSEPTAKVKPQPANPMP